MSMNATGALSAEETTQLDRARLFGGVSAQIYADGVFSESEFIIYGVLQRLAIRGLLTCVDLRRDERTASYAFHLVYTMEDERLIAA